MPRKILLVDDEEDFLKLMSKVMELWGYRVVTAANAQEALEVSKRERPDILVLDYLMPELNGIELLKELRKIGLRSPAIIFTANPTIKAMEESKQLDITAFIPKISSRVDTQEDLKMTLELLCR
jgi:DNA-binding NtrC family response regulator